MSRLIAALLLVLVSRPALLAGQAEEPTTLLRPGARIRITQPGAHPRVAILVARNSEELVVQGPKFANDEGVQLGQIARLEVSTGRHRNLLKGMALGAAIGRAGGLIFGAAAYQPCTGMCIMAPKNRGESAAMGGSFFGTLGLLVGTIAGVRSHDSWQRVPLDDLRARATVGLQASGRGVGIALKF
jgi:hypothetical protein